MYALPWICYEIGFSGNECIQHTVWRSDTEYAILCRLMQVTICDKEAIDMCVYMFVWASVFGCHRKKIGLIDAYAR